MADVVGGTRFAACLDALRRGGRYATSGTIAGPLVQLDLRTLHLNDLEIYGATVFAPSVFADLVGCIERDEVRPVIARVYPLEDIHTAEADFEREDHIDSLVVSLHSMRA